MAFTCRPCHKKPMRAWWCATMFETGHADSFGPCENCGAPSPCNDCQCPTIIPEERIDVETEPVAERGETIRIEQPEWLRCSTCGKHGSHEHRQAMLGDYVDSEHVGTSSADLADDYAMLDRFSETFPGLVAWVAFTTLPHYLQDEIADAIERQLLRRTATEALQSHRAAQQAPQYVCPEHEPGNKNCLCFQQTCVKTPRLTTCPRCKHELLGTERDNEQTCDYVTNDGCCCACWNVISGNGPLDVRDGG